MARAESSSSEGRASTADTLTTIFDEGQVEDYVGGDFNVFSKQHALLSPSAHSSTAPGGMAATNILSTEEKSNNLIQIQHASPLRTSPFLVLRSHESPSKSHQTSTCPEPPTTPVRRQSAKELIHHFEAQSASPRRPLRGSTPMNVHTMMASSSSSSHFPPSEMRLNGPLPAIPLLEPKMISSPSRSPIRSLMNMMKGRKRNKQRSISPSPMPKRRAMLEEDDQRDSLAIPEYYQTRIRDTLVGRITPDLRHTRILRTGSLLYASKISTLDTWHHTHAVLQAPTLRLDLDSTSLCPNPFRSFNLRDATVESLSSLMLDKATAVELGIEENDGSGLDGRTVYIFELTLHHGSGSGMKERFASMSPWDRGKWVCHLWDAICSANGSSFTDFDPQPDPSTPATGSLSSQYDDPDFHRHRPPLRVVNVSKLSAFFEPNVSHSVSYQDQPAIPLRFSQLSDTLTSNPTTSYGLRSAPIIDSSNIGEETGPRAEIDPSVRSRSVPPTPSVHDLGNLSLVRQHLARFESQSSNYSSHPEIGGKRTELGTFKNPMQTGGLSTPPISPEKDLQPRRAPSTTGRRGTLPYILPNEAVVSTQVPRASGRLEMGDLPKVPATSSLLLRRAQRGLASGTDPKSSPRQEHNDKGSPVCGKGPLLIAADDVTDAKKTLLGSEPWTQPAEPTSERHLKGNSTNFLDKRFPMGGSLPDHPDISPLFALVRDAAMEQVAQAKFLSGTLQNIRGELDELKKQGSVVERKGSKDTPGIGDEEEVKKDIKEIKEKLEAALNLTANQDSQTISVEKGIEDIRMKLELLANTSNSCPTTAPPIGQLPHNELQISVQSIPVQLESVHIAQKETGSTLERVSATADAVNEGAIADRALWGAKFAELKEALSLMTANIEAAPLETKLREIREAIDALRIDTPEAKKRDAGDSGGPPLLPERSMFSVFRNKPGSTLKPTEQSPPSDLSSLHDKLDAISITMVKPDLSSMTEKLDSVLALCRNVMEKMDKPDIAVSRDEGGSNDESSQNGGKVDLSELLNHLQQDQEHREKYYSDLNSWLSNATSQTGTQYHAIATQLQAFYQLFAPSAEVLDVPVQTESSDSAHHPKNLLQEIRQALEENNHRNQTSDNFLAAASHVIGTANAERQNLVALIGRQRTENEMLLEKFAETIATEIRGEKHRFVDAMEKATAINVETQLQELKGQISVQLLSMAKEVERLRDERKGLEHQIAELLTFKNRFGAWNHQLPPPTPSPPTNPSQQSLQDPAYLPYPPIDVHPHISAPQMPQDSGRMGRRRPLPVPSPRLQQSQNVGQHFTAPYNNPF